MRQNWLEWTVLSVSVVALLALVGFLVVDGLRDEGAPPIPVVEMRPDEAYLTDHGWILPATIRNDGDIAAASLVLRATAEVDGEQRESELTVDYLPAGTSVEVSIGFDDEPSGSVRVEVVGFRLP